MSGFLGGLIHPLAIPGHALALLALALLIGHRQRREGIVALAAFVVGLVVGLAGIAFGVGETPSLDLLLAATALAAGLVVLAIAVPVTIRAGLAAVTGVALGLDSPPEAISLAVGMAMLIGAGLGASLVLALLATGVSYLTRPWQRIGIRIVASWIAASAILVLALRFARGQLF
jgi:urease accessory protein